MQRTVFAVLALLALGSDAIFLRNNKHGRTLDLKKGKFVVALDRDMHTKMLVQTNVEQKKSKIVDPCAEITCGSPLQCPAGFLIEEVPGHCCPYCVNPNIKVEDIVTGPTGEHGGTESTFCADVWCFPSLCLKPETAPTTTNGLCCPSCPAL